jgi:DNA repair photolyase
MTTAISLPLLDGLTEPETASKEGRPRLPRVMWRVRRGPLLHANPLSDDPGVLSLNLAQGCMHRCTFCSVRGHAAYRGNDEIGLYANSAEQLKAELARRSILPRAVVISPSSDPFAPNLLIQESTLSVVRVLAEADIESWLMTRGLIRPDILEGLIPHRDKLRLRIALTTANRQLQRQVEPLTAPPMLRFRQLRALRDLGIRLDVAIEPLLPGVTDTQENLRPLLRRLADAGIEQVSAGYAFMRAGIRANVEQTLEQMGLRIEDLDEAYSKGPILTSGLIAAARYLPRVRRERNYASLMAWGEEVGVRVSVCGTTNPDFHRQRAPAAVAKPRLSLLSLLASADHAG